MLLALLTLSALAEPPPPPEDASFIINGEDAFDDDYPMTGGMLLDADVTSFGGSQHIRTFVCSSTLIAPDVVVLAAHCLDDLALTSGFGTVDNKAVFWTREADLTDLDGTNANASFPEDTIEAWDWVMHPDFSLEDLQTGLADNADIALLFLDEPVLDVDPAVVITAEEDATEVIEDAPVRVVGWGQQQQVELFQQPPPGTYAIKQWGDSHIEAIGPTEFKVGEVEDDVRKCHGDSGGPTFLELSQTDSVEPERIIGVTSHAWDDTDCRETGGVDTRLSAYLEWMDTEMALRCDDRAWCDEPGILPPPTRADERGGGCGCDSSPAPFGGLGVLGLAGLLARRRQTLG